jgi:hypothetical protein
MDIDVEERACDQQLKAVDESDSQANQDFTSQFMMLQRSQQIHHKEEMKRLDIQKEKEDRRWQEEIDTSVERSSGSREKKWNEDDGCGAKNRVLLSTTLECFYVCDIDFSDETVAQKIEEDLKNTVQKLNDSQTDLVHERQMNSTLRTQVVFSLEK